MFTALLKRLGKALSETDTPYMLIGQPDTIDPADLQARFDGALAASQPKARNPLAAATEWVRRLWTVADHEG